MPYDKNEPDYAGGPKKADIIIKNTHNLAARQEELVEQTRIAVSKIEEAIALFGKGNMDSSDVVTRNSELFAQLQGENSALKQELLYLAKQSENIYAGLAEKITELSEQAKVREDAMTGFADRLNDVSEQTKKSGDNYSTIADKLTEIAEHGKRSTELYNELSNRLDVISAFTSSGAYVPASEKGEAPSVDLTSVLDKLDAISTRLNTLERTEQPAVSPSVAVQPAVVDLTAVMTKLDSLSDQIRKNERAYAELSGRVSERVTEKVVTRDSDDFTDVFDKLNRISEQLRRSESAHSMLADKFEILSMRVEQYAYESGKNAPAFRQQPQVAVAPIPAPVQTVVREEKEIDYDKLAEKIASLISSREVISPDYIASRVAEQIIIPEAEAPNVNVSVDADYIASKVVSRIVIPEPEPANVNVSVDADYIAKQVADILGENAEKQSAEKAPLFDEQALVEKIAERVCELRPEEKSFPDEAELADRIAGRLAELNPAEEITPAADIDSDELADKIAQRLNSSEAQKELAPAVVNDIDGEELAEKIAGKLGAYNPQVFASAVSVPASIDEEALAQRIADKISNTAVQQSYTPYDVDEEELADAISLKVGSLKAEDFEILVDDEGCSSISKGIADNLDYNMISGIIADKLREALDLAAVNAPDYEEMAERISEKITVAGINEDAIADKAAAVLSNYLPEFDTEEITDKITGAVIDVVSAIPAPSVDSDGICNTITERLIESQEDHDYDIVIDDDGIARITELVSEEITRGTDARFDRVEENLQKLSDIIARIDDNTVDNEEARPEDDYSRISEIVAEEIEKSTASRFDKVEDGLNRLTELDRKSTRLNSSHAL